MPVATTLLFTEILRLGTHFPCTLDSEMLENRERYMTHPDISGPKGLPFVGNLREFAGADRIGNMMRWKAEYGETIHIKLVNRDAYILTNPADIYEVLVKSAHKVHKSPILKKGLTRALGEGLLLSEEDFHKRQRRLTQPAFHTQRITSYADTIVDYGQTMVNSWGDQSQLDVHHEMMTVTMQVIAKVLFDADVSEDADDLGHAITVGIESAMHKITNPMALPDWVPTARNRKTNKVYDLLNTTVNDMIEARRQTMEDKGDLLSMLLLSTDENGERMNDKQVRDEAMTLFLAGHETTANALTWALYLLSENPDIREKLVTEIDTVIGQRRATLTDLKQLTYTQQVIKEAMRLYPPAWILTRIVQEPFELSKFTAQPNNIMIVSQYLTHRDPQYWENPNQFDPSRWTPEAENDHTKFAYFPFGGGPRVCMGNHFAMMEAQLVLATILQHATVDLAPNTTIIPEPVITLRPLGGLPMTVTLREHEAEPTL